MQRFLYRDVVRPQAKRHDQLFAGRLALDEFFKKLLASFILASDDEVAAHKDEILAFAANEGVTLSTHSQQLIDAAIDKSNWGVFGGPIKATLTNGINQSISNLTSEAQAQEAQLLALIVAGSRNYAKSLEG